MIIAAYVSLGILGLLAIFQLLLALGAPLGHFAWGGQQKTLSAKFRIGSVVSIVIYALCAVLIIGKAGIFEVPLSSTILNVGAWFLAVYFTLGVLMNAISRSKPERYTMTPVALILATCLFVLALS